MTISISNQVTYNAGLSEKPAIVELKKLIIRKYPKLYDLLSSLAIVSIAHSAQDITNISISKAGHYLKIDFSDCSDITTHIPNLDKETLLIISDLIHHVKENANPQLS